MICAGKVKKKTRELEIEDVISSRWYILIIGILLILKTILFYADTVFFSEKIWLWTVRQTIFFIVILLSPLLLFRSSKTRFIIGQIFNFTVSIILFADELYFEYASNILSVMQAGNIQYKDEILAAIPSLLNLRQILYFIDFPILIILFLRGTISVKKRKNFEFKPVLIMIIGIAILCSNYKFVPESMELVTGFIYNKNKSVRYGTIYGYHTVDILNAITNKKTVDYDNYDEMKSAYDELKEFQNKNYPIKVEFQNIGNGKNCISLQLESIQNFVINAQINGKEIMPNLNKFLAENIQVTNMHASSYTTTADSEHSMLNSMYPLENGEAFSKYYSNTYDDIFKRFKIANYTNIYTHGNYAYFWNRANVISKYNVDQKYFLEDFEDTSELIRTYLSDELLYKQVLDKVGNQNIPFFLDMIAASSHKPFDLSGIINKEEKVNIDVGKYKDTELGLYLESCNYADYAFGIFLNKLKEKGLYDNTVIIVFGDHYGMQMYDENLIEFLGENKDNYNNIRMQLEFTKVACGIRVPGISGYKIEQPTSKIDIKPTLLSILGIEDEFSLGKNMFDGKPFVCINNGKIITKDYYYDSIDWYYIYNGQKIDMNSIDENTRKTLDEYVVMANKELGISNSIVVENLLKENIK